MAARNVILLKGELERKYEEARAADAGIKPGHLIALNTDGELVLHPDDGDPAEVLVATECDFLGRTVDDAYDADELVHHHLAQKGDVIQVRVATGVTIDQDDFGCSAGNGLFRIAVLGTDTPLVKFMEDIVTSGETFVKARVL